MKPVEFEGQTLLLQPPAGTPRGACGILPVIEFSDPPCMTSFWKPTAEELELLNAGGHVRLDAAVTLHPPVSLSVEKVMELP